jgi:hypothetical protein
MIVKKVSVIQAIGLIEKLRDLYDNQLNPYERPKFQISSILPYVIKVEEFLHFSRNNRKVRKFLSKPIGKKMLSSWARFLGYFINQLEEFLMVNKCYHHWQDSSGNALSNS